MRLVIILALLSFVNGAIAQQNSSSLIALKIDRDSLMYEESNKSLTVPFTFFNKSKSDIIVYGVPSVPKPVPFDLHELCNTKGAGTGIAFVVYRSNGDRESYQITITDKFNQNAVTRDMLDSVLRASNDRFLKTKRILKDGECVSTEKELSLAEFFLQPGLYYLELAYYCGENIFSIKGASDVNGHRTPLFQGCSISNRIPFLVK